MKKIFFEIAAIAVFFSGIVLFGCQSPSEKTDKAQDKVADAREDLKEAQQDAAAAAQKAAKAEEWKVFKSETEVKIENNKTRIAELRDKMKKSGKTMDKVYAANIDLLEERNKKLKERLDAYETSQSDWEAFKREFNHDMDELGQALKDFTVNNKK